MLPPFESQLTPGTEKLSLKWENTALGVAISKDMDFTSISRDYGQMGVGLILVPAWDFNLDRIWHGHMAIMRGVEGGFSMARAARDGYLTVSDDRGRNTIELRDVRDPASPDARRARTDLVSGLGQLVRMVRGWRFEHRPDARRTSFCSL